MSLAIAAPRRRLFRRETRARLAVASLAGAVFLAGLGALPLSSPNEGLYAEVSREMLEGGDLVVPRADGVVYLEKPPLFYWLTAASLRVFGRNAFAARLASSLAALAAVWLVMAAGRRLFGGLAGAVSGVVLATALGFAFMARQVMFDALLTLWVTAALLAFWFGTSTDASEGSRRRILLAGYAALALGVITKGLVAILIPALVLLVDAAVSRDVRRLRAAWSLPGGLLFLAIAVPWHVAAAVRQKEFAAFYFVNEHWLRFLGRRKPPDFHQDPIFAPILALLLLALPWTVLLPEAARTAISRSSGGTQRRMGSFLLTWALVPAVFFTISRTRTYYYLLPVVPPLALLAGMLWTHLRGRGRERLSSSGVLAPIALFWLVCAGRWLYCGLHSHEPTRGAALRAVAFAGGSWLVLSLAAAFAFALRRRRGALFACLAAGSAATLATALLFASKFRPQAFVSEEPAARIVRRNSPVPGTVIAMEGKFENHSSFAFYLPRELYPILAVEGHGGGDLEFGGHLPGQPRVFITTAELFELSGRKPLYYLAKTPSRLALPNSLKILRRDAESTLWSNCVPPNHPHPPTNSPFELGPESSR